MVRPSPALRSRSWILVLVVGIAALAWDTRVRLEHSALAHALADGIAPAPREAPDSPTGYELGQRRLILGDAGVDGYHWVMQTQQMLARGEARIRHVEYDNAPDGRAVHWASPFRWWLGGLAWIDQTLHGQSPGIAVERAALVASPLLLAVILCLLSTMAAMRFGPLAGSLIVLVLLGARACYAYFAAGNPDHHGIAIATAFTSVFGIVAGGSGAVSIARPASDDPLSPPLPCSARRWFALSALAGGIGLWNSASTQIQVLAGIGLGAMVAIWITRRPQSGASWKTQPELWRWWGAIGAVTSLIAYAIEYFPGHASLRLEVNHPFHALAWLAAGEFLHRIARLTGAAPIERRRDILAALGALALTSVPLVAVAIGGSDVFVVADRFYTLLSVGFTTEGWSLGQHLLSDRFARTAAIMALPVLALAPAVIAAMQSRPAPTLRAGLVLGLGPALVVAGWGVAEIRWLGIATALVAIPWIPVLHLPSHRWVRGLAWASLLTLAPGWIALITHDPAGFSRQELQRITERDMAHWLKRRTGAAPLVVLAGPGRTTSFVFFAGGRGLGTFYWENRAGIEKTAAILRAVDEMETRALLASSGITHVVLPTWDRFEQVVRSLDARLHPGAPAPEPYLHRVARTKIFPPWLRPLPYMLPRHELLDEESVLILEIDDDAAPADAPNRLAQYLLETGRADTALRLRRALERTPDHLPSLVTLTRLLQETGRHDEAAGLLERVSAGLHMPDALEPEDQIRLASVWVRARQAGAARETLALGLSGLDERSVRRLTPAVLAELVVLSDAFHLRHPETAVEELIRSLSGASGPAPSAARP